MIRRPSLGPDSLFARMALILLLGLLATQGISLWLHWGERTAVVTQTHGQRLIERVAEVVRLLEAEPPSQRQATLSVLQSPDLRISTIDAGQIFPRAPRGQMQHAIASRLGDEREMRTSGGMGGGGGAGRGDGRMGMGRGGQGMPSGNAPRAVDVRLADGQWIRVVTALETETPGLPTEFFVTLTLSLLIIAGVVLLVVRLATRPLQQFADAAEAFGHDLEAPPLSDRGPRETRQAVQAFNRMQQRIRRLIDERTRALAAVSHDLRTPLTRLRLRAELVEDDKLREQMAIDLDAMAAMIDSTLDHLRGQQENESVQPIDIDALLQSLADDAAVLGRPVDVTGAALAPFPGRLNALRRALQNLIDNAIRYGHGAAHLRVEDAKDALHLIVEDDGPGIPPEELERVIEPYYRPDSSRNRETGGVGLGLSIANDIARLHGGKLILSNRERGGLSACLNLPRHA